MPERPSMLLADKRRPLWLRDRRYWRYVPLWRWLFELWPERCMSCGRRRDHDEGCYFA